jgi:type IV secretory pathway VirB4 component
MPVFSRWEGSRRPVTLFLDQLKRLVKHDPFPNNQLNRNKTICGKSGSGKSFATQLADIQPHAARDNTEILIVESGGSFELTTRCFGGMFIKLGPSSPYFINPFDLPAGFEALPKDTQEIELRYKYGFIKNLVMAMARLNDSESQSIAENVVGTVAQRTYQQSKTPRFRDFYRLLGEYRNKEDPSAETLAGKLRTRLANYVVNEAGESGIFAHYFDTFSNFDADVSIITFDLIDVKNDPALLTPMCMVTLLGLIYNRLLKRDGKEKLVIVDEAWALIKAGPNGEQSPAGQGIELFWREGRKLGASSAMISQNFSDMTEDAVGRAVVGNSPIQYFLVHERLKANDDAFRSANFSKEKIEKVYNLRTVYGEYSEILIKEGEEWGVIQLPSAGMKYWLATTDPKDLNVRNRYYTTFKDGYNLPEIVVVALLAEDYPGGYHGAHGAEMPVNDAIVFAEKWQDHFRRFSERVARGERIPPDFR